MLTHTVKEIIMNEDRIRQRVSEAYTKAISGSTDSCCGAKTGCCGSDTTASCTTAEMIGYSKAEVSEQPGAAISSFGCGNPLAFSDVKEGDVVLDLGSGAGLDLLLAGAKVGATGKVIGIDMTDAMIERAEKNIKAAGVTNVEVRKGLIEALPVESTSVDWVISNCVINLSPEKSKVFSEIHRVLKPGGRMRVSDIVAEELPQEIRQSEAFYNSCVAGAVSEKEYLTGLQKAGLDDIHVLERVVYDAKQIRAFLGTEDVSELLQIFPEQTEPVRQEAVNMLIHQIAGKIWSAKFAATKPMH